MPNTTDQNADIEKDLAELAQSPILKLRQRWRALFRSEPPGAFGPDLLRRSIAQRVQEQHYGGLSTNAQKELGQIIKAMTSKPNGRIELPRRIKPGAVLVRTWRDKSHRVTVLDNCFVFEGRTYVSLSEIAREITSTRWNGPKFFGLRAKSSPSSENAVLPTPGKMPGRRGGAPETSSDLFNSGMGVGYGL